MLLVIGLAGAWLAGAPVWLVGAGVIAARWPMAGLVGLAAAIGVGWWRELRSGRTGSGGETLFFTAMASELRAGSSLRIALGAAAARSPGLRLQAAGRRAAAGLPATAVASELASALPRSGRLVGAAFTLAAETGARAADVFETLAARAASHDDLIRERRTLTAQAQLSAVVVGAIPVLVVIGLVVTGRAGELMALGPAGWAVVVVGGALELLGVAVVVIMLWRASL